MKKRLLSIVAAGLITSAAHAAPITFDFAGSGQLCTYTGGTSESCAATAFTGAVTIDVLTSVPSGPDSGGDGVTNAYANSGWVQSDFIIQWAGNSFNPGPVPGSTYTSSFASVWNGLIGIDMLTNEERYEGFVDGTPAGTYYLSYASLRRSTFDTTWLSDLSFNTSVGLAPDSLAGDGVYFGNSTQDIDGYTGFHGNIELATFTQRVTPVPEPTTWAMMGCALVGLGLFRAIRRQRPLAETSSSS
jgi:hypothetical protein